MKSGALILSDYPGDGELALLVVIPHTTALRGKATAEKVYLGLK